MKGIKNISKIVIFEIVDKLRIPFFNIPKRPELLLYGIMEILQAKVFIKK